MHDDELKKDEEEKEVGKVEIDNKGDVYEDLDQHVETIDLMTHDSERKSETITIEDDPIEDFFFK